MNRLPSGARGCTRIERSSRKSHRMWKILMRHGLSNFTYPATLYAAALARSER